VGAWKPEQYRDDYRKDLLSLIHARAKAGEVNTVSKEHKKAPRAEKPSKVVDLVALLSQSMQSGHHRAKKATHKAAAPARRAKSNGHAHARTKRAEHATTHHRKSA